LFMPVPYLSHLMRVLTKRRCPYRNGHASLLIGCNVVALGAFGAFVLLGV
jgi:hypothetical protein